MDPRTAAGDHEGQPYRQLWRDGAAAGHTGPVECRGRTDQRRGMGRTDRGGCPVPGADGCADHGAAQCARQRPQPVGRTSRCHGGRSGDLGCAGAGTGPDRAIRADDGLLGHGCNLGTGHAGTAQDRWADRRHPWRQSATGRSGGAGRSLRPAVTQKAAQKRGLSTGSRRIRPRARSAPDRRSFAPAPRPHRKRQRLRGSGAPAPPHKADARNSFARAGHRCGAGRAPLLRSTADRPN
ncbi:UNVERIFIED_CONTAM: hypothetical protein NCL1_00584 [Trichonephila clavipes]